MTEAAGGRRDNLALGVAAIVLAVFALSLGDAAIKSFDRAVPLWQLYIVRSLLALPLLLLIVRLRRRGRSLVPRALGWTALRSLLLAAMWIAYYLALPSVQLPLAAAAYYTAPLFIVLLAAPLVGERVGPRGWLAVSLGFAGVLVMLRPDGESFDVYALLPVLAAVLYALAMLLTRTKCLGEDPLVLSLALNVTFVAVGALAGAAVALLGPDGALVVGDYLLGPWVPLEPAAWLVFAGLALAIVVGSVGAAVAYQVAPPQVVATFDYAYLVFATLWGLLIFAEVPDALAIAGIVMIALAGLLVVRR